jgi:hypothetical protein
MGQRNPDKALFKAIDELYSSIGGLQAAIDEFTKPEHRSEYMDLSQIVAAFEQNAKNVQTKVSTARNLNDGNDNGATALSAMLRAYANLTIAQLTLQDGGRQGADINIDPERLELMSKKLKDILIELVAHGANLDDRISNEDHAIIRRTLKEINLLEVLEKAEKEYRKQEFQAGRRNKP